MREIDAATISDAVARLAVQACCHLPADVRDAFRQRLDEEPSPVGRNILEQLLENADIAARDDIPICQDTGLAVVFAEVGQEVHITGGDFEAAIHEGVRRGYVDGYLRKSCVAEPLFERRNTGDNTPAVIHTRIVPGDGLTLRLAPKGAGSENKSVVKMLVPADGIEGVRKVVLDAVLAAEKGSLRTAIDNIGKFSTALGENSERFSSMIANLDRFSQQLTEADIDSLSLGLRTTLGELNRTVARINEGKGTVGRLMNDPRLYESLETASANLAALLEDLKAHPKRYVHFSLFGRKDKGEKVKTKEAAISAGDSLPAAR